MSDLPVLEWNRYGEDPDKEVNPDCGATAELGGVVTLYAFTDGWRVNWNGDDADCDEGPASSLEDGKQKARAFAKTLLRQVLEQLDRAHDPVTGLLVQLPEEAPHAG